MEGKNEVADALGPRAESIGGVNVSVSSTGTEAQMVGKERWEQIQRLRAAGQSVSAIAR
ncbi:MAG: hypothetical protein H6951_09690 [Zoogloeaceae bacterium]|nr:hypothetical protein [Zoogloeaceae bacterium]